jgi:TorA maturation chaperone TorD
MGTATAQAPEVLEYRMHLYSLLASIFGKRPEIELTDLLKASLFADELVKLGLEGSDLQCLSDARKLSEEELLQQLRVEYTKLLSAPTKEHVAPYQSVYTDQLEVNYHPYPALGHGSAKELKEGLLWGSSAASVVKYYRTAHLEYQSSSGQLPDHISVQLEFMAYLLRQLTENCSDEEFVEQNLARQADFFQQFLGKWVEDFAAKIIAANTTFYKLFGYLLMKFLKAEKNLFRTP